MTFVNWNSQKANYNYVFEIIYAINGFTSVVPCMELIQDINVKLIPFSSKDFKLIASSYKANTIDGFTLKQPDGTYEIAFNKDMIMPRIKMTIYHELGHIYLKHFSERSFILENEKEKEANVFASHLLLPHSLLHDYRDGYMNEHFDEFLRNSVSNQALEIRCCTYELDQKRIERVLANKNISDYERAALRI